MLVKKKVEYLFICINYLLLKFKRLCADILMVMVAVR